MPTLEVFDETAGRGPQAADAVSFSQTRVTVRDIIVERVRQEALRRNKGGGLKRPALVEPGPVEQLLNPPQPRAVKPVDVERQCEIALQAFKDRGFVLLVDDRHLDSLDDEVELGAESRVTFLRLVPLVGG